MFREERTESMFEWNSMGDIAVGRPNLGPSVQVNVYRLMQYTLRDVMIQRIGVAAADGVFYEAGRRAGEGFYNNIVVKAFDLNDFVLKLQHHLREQGIGILRVEKADVERQQFTLTVAEDLDCSGLPVCDEQICVYDEGFIAGLFFGFTGNVYHVKEVDCWCSGDRVCRFEVNLRENTHA